MFVICVTVVIIVSIVFLVIFAITLNAIIIAVIMAMCVLAVVIITFFHLPELCWSRVHAVPDAAQRPVPPAPSGLPTRRASSWLIR